MTVFSISSTKNKLELLLETVGNFYFVTIENKALKIQHLTAVVGHLLPPAI
jgi:hypothetical protein